ncbi:MAG: cobalamin biosynthesis protein [Candidatus Bathyarchaeia archaeon]
MINTGDVLIALCVLLLALVIDLVFGDPSPNMPWKIRYKLHPTVWMGKLTRSLEIRLRNPNPKIEKLDGVILALIVITTFTLPTYFLLELIKTYFGIIVYIIVAALILKSAICVKLETEWAIAASEAIKANDLKEARKYAHFSRRDPTSLTGSQIASSVVESMAENLTDFKLSPLLYYALFGVPGVIAFRAINTLDGMVGFKDPIHINIGWFSAKLDTLANYIPARLTTLLIVVAAAILGEDHKNAWIIACRDQAKVPSINHGWLMAAMAGALNVQLEKPGYYVIGDKKNELSYEHILKALKIRNTVMVLFLVLICFPLMLLSNFVFGFIFNVTPF